MVTIVAMLNKIDDKLYFVKKKRSVVEIIFYPCDQKCLKFVSAIQQNSDRPIVMNFYQHMGLETSRFYL